MKNFKPGMQVVFSTEFLVGGYEDRPEYNFPANGEIVTIQGLGPKPGWWFLEGYSLSWSGKQQQITDEVLFHVRHYNGFLTEKLVQRLQAERQDSATALNLLAQLLLSHLQNTLKNERKDHRI